MMQQVTSCALVRIIEMHNSHLEFVLVKPKYVNTLGSN